MQRASQLCLIVNTPKDYYVFKETRDSDCFSMVGYQEVRQELLVCFRTTGVYFYYDVPKSEYNSFVEADSLGTYFDKYIKSNYRCERGNDMDNEFINDMLEESTYEDLREEWIADNYNEYDYEGVDPTDAFNDYLMSLSEEDYYYE